MHFQSAGERLAVGEIDPRCVSDTNELPMLTPELAAAHSWIPEPVVWEAIKKHSMAGRAIVTIRGFSARDDQHAVSSGRTTLSTSIDPVGAPIFYRDVPLMPSEIEKGSSSRWLPARSPLSRGACANRKAAQPHGLEGLPHLRQLPFVFSATARPWAWISTAPQNDKGLMPSSPSRPEMSIRNQDVISWIPSGTTRPQLRVGFMSQVSPDGRYVLTNYAVAGPGTPRTATTSSISRITGFLQVFYPTRGILAWYNRATGRMQPCPAPMIPRYVQTNAVWSPDGKYLVFARARRRTLSPGRKDAAICQRPEGDPNPVRPLPNPFQRRQGWPAGTDRRSLLTTE